MTDRARRSLLLKENQRDLKMYELVRMSSGIY